MAPHPRHSARAIPELVATGPGQISTWRINKLPGPTKGKYYDCYVMLSFYSRYIVGAAWINKPREKAGTKIAA